MKKLWILLILGLLGLNAVCFAEDKLIEVIPADFPIQGVPLKLNDGKILIYGKGFDIGGIKPTPNILFDPATKKFQLTTSFDETMAPDRNAVPAVVLDNGKALFIAPRHFYTTFSLSNKGYKLIPNDISKTLYKKSIAEQQKVFLSYIKQDNELYKEYKRQFKNYEKSIYAQLFNPETEKIELTGKLNIRRYGFSTVKAKNGKVYIFGGKKEDDNKRSVIANEIEMYNPDTGKFTIIATPELYEIHKAIALDDGRIFLANTNMNGYTKFTNYTFFDPKTNRIGEWKTHDETFYEAIKLKNDKILFFVKRGDGIAPKDLKYKEDNDIISKDKYNGYILFAVIYDPKTDKFSEAGNLLVPRAFMVKPAIVLLDDGNVLIAGGIRYPKLYDFVPVYEIEIYNPSTHKSIVAGELPFKLQNTISGINTGSGQVLIFGSSAQYIANYSKAILFNPNVIKK